MPGLKGQNEVKNIRNLIERRGTQTIDIQPAPAKKTEIEPVRKHLYEDVFKQQIGSTTRAKYETGKLPRLHKQFYEAIIEAMDGQESIVEIGPILKELQTTYCVSIRILSCLEAYGYLQISRKPNARGKRLIFRVLKKVPKQR